MLDDATLKQKLEDSPAPRVTEDDINKKIKEKEFTRINSTVTVCNIILDNGFSVRGESACVDPANYNEEIGQHYAEVDARRKLWPLFGFMLAEDLYREKSQQQAA